jgi:hypothetical protein
MEVKLIKITCAHESCSVPFWVEEGYDERRSKSGKTFYCPNGHPNVYNQGKSTEDILREQNREKNSKIFTLEREVEVLKKKCKTKKKK